MSTLTSIVWGSLVLAALAPMAAAEATSQCVDFACAQVGSDPQCGRDAYDDEFTGVFLDNGRRMAELGVHHTCWDLQGQQYGWETLGVSVGDVGLGLGGAHVVWMDSSYGDEHYTAIQADATPLAGTGAGIIWEGGEGRGWGLCRVGVHAAAQQQDVDCAGVFPPAPPV